ncbi:MAG: RNA 2',3'-cyclic phosphodiesterase [candidate division WOR-3 bacterium]|mgnify:CR=1 FL=1|uniref:RNA 2',3'-cyclic phosphodiesterase n=1 Tax=candidate division WOR-3 bacterium TaxID=2052148 RepID=A0A7C1WMB5_UNCW3|nr:RNA 2',3'-cyclic phosphodiesterase [candidate division WOR-3 bacterium]
MSEKIRSFVAVDTSVSVRGELARLVKDLEVKTEFSVKWVKPEQMHITLAFLGEVTSEFVQNAESRLKQSIAGFPEFSCQLAGLGAFPSVNRARVIWAGVGTGADRVIALQREVVQTLMRIGFVPERRPFSPHLTLGRMRVPVNVQFINSVSFVSSEWRVSELIIYQSELHPSGPVYTPLVRLQLSTAEFSSGKL